MAHTVFGVPQTINSANYVYFLALERTLALSHPEGVQIFARKLHGEDLLNHTMHICRAPGIDTGQLLELHRGQGKEIHWRDGVQCPSEEEYMDMIKQSRQAPPTLC